MTPKITNTIILAAMALAVGGCTGTTGKKQPTASATKQTASAAINQVTHCKDPLPRPILWLKADAGVSGRVSGTPPYPVKAWNDIPGSPGDGHHFSSHPGSRPTRAGVGAPIHFQGNQWLTNSALTGVTGRDQNRLNTAPYTTIVYFRSNATNPVGPGPLKQSWNAPATMIGGQAFQGSSAVGIGRAGGGGSNVQAVYAYINPPQPASTVHRNFSSASGHMIAVIDDSGHKGLDTPVNISLFVDSSPAVNFSSSVLHDHFVRQITCIGGGAPASVPTSGNFNEAGNKFRGDIYEVLIFDQPLTCDQIRCIHGYLVKKWH